MKTVPYTRILAVIVVMMFSAVSALAQTALQPGMQKPVQHDMATMDMDPYFTVMNLLLFRRTR